MKALISVLVLSLFFLTSCSKNTDKPPTIVVNDELIGSLEKNSEEVAVIFKEDYLLKDIFLKEPRFYNAYDNNENFIYVQFQLNMEKIKNINLQTTYIEIGERSISLQDYYLKESSETDNVFTHKIGTVRGVPSTIIVSISRRDDHDETEILYCKSYDTGGEYDIDYYPDVQLSEGLIVKEDLVLFEISSFSRQEQRNNNKVQCRYKICLQNPSSENKIVINEGWTPFFSSHFLIYGDISGYKGQEFNILAEIDSVYDAVKYGDRDISNNQKAFFLNQIRINAGDYYLEKNSVKVKKTNAASIDEQEFKINLRINYNGLQKGKDNNGLALLVSESADGLINYPSKNEDGSLDFFVKKGSYYLIINPNREFPESNFTNNLVKIDLRSEEED